MIKYTTSDSSDSIGTKITIGTSDTTTAPPYGLNVIPEIGNIRQSATPDLRDSDKLDTSIDGNFTNNLVAPPIVTDVISDKLFNSSRQDLYARVGMNLEEYPVNPVTSQFVYLGLSTVDALDKEASLLTPATRVGISTDFSHQRAPDHIFGTTTAAGGAVNAKLYYNYKTGFGIWK